MSTPLSQRGGISPGLRRLLAVVAVVAVIGGLLWIGTSRPRFDCEAAATAGERLGAEYLELAFAGDTDAADAVLDEAMELGREYEAAGCP